MKTIIIEIFRWIYWYPFRLVMEWLPLSLVYWIAGAAARIGILIPQGKLAKIHQGLKSSYPEKPEPEIRELVRKTFENYLMNACEVFRYPRLNKRMMEEMVEYTGLEKIEEALKQKKGVILAHGHFGNEELLMPAIGYKGYTAHQLGSRLEPPEYHGFLSGLVNYIRMKAYQKRIGYRESFPVNFHYVDKNLRPAIRCLQENEILLFAVDGREGNQWETMDFMNRKAQFSPGLGKIAKLSGAIVLPVFLIRQPNRRHKLIVHDPLPTDPRDELVVVKGFISLLDSYIQKNPEQYAKVFFLVKGFFRG